jgi:hypothetical protein
MSGKRRGDCIQFHLFWLYQSVFEKQIYDKNSKYYILQKKRLFYLVNKKEDAHHFDGHSFLY